MWQANIVRGMKLVENVQCGRNLSLAVFFIFMCGSSMPQAGLELSNFRISDKAAWPPLYCTVYQCTYTGKGLLKSCIVIWVEL